MMKSFFKKLSFVMALAMVVTTAAPAAQASAAGEMGIALQSAKSKSEVIAEYTMKVGEAAVDFKYYGAPKDYLKQNPTWTSSDEAVATVDKYGVVTPVAAGTATIEIALDNGMTGEIAVTVKAAYEADVDQLTEISSRIVFDKKVSFAKEDAKLYRIFETAEGPVEVFWPINVWDLAKDGKSVTFAPFVQYNDGDQYVLRVGGYEEYFTTAIGEVTHVLTTYGNNDPAYDNNIAYITTEDMDDDQVSKLNVKIYSGAIELTNVYKSKYEISYEFVGTEAEHIDLDGDDGEIVCNDKGAAVITAVLSYEDEEGEDKTVANVMPATVTPVNVPAYEIVSVADWAIYKSGDFSWSNKSVPAGDDDYQLVVKLVDSYGNSWVNHEKAAESWNKVFLIDEENEDLAFVKNGYSIKFFSTNTDKYLVDEDGEVATYEKAKATIYVSLYKDTEDEDDVFVKNIYAFTLDITGAREIDSFKNDGSKVELVVDAMVEWENEFTTKKYNYSLLDQYGADWTGDADFEITTSPEVAEGCGWEDNAGHIFIDANELIKEIGKKTSVKFTITETNSKEKMTFTVSLKKPDWVGDKEVKEDDKVAQSIDGKLFLETSKTLTEVELGTADVNLAYMGWVDGWSNPSGVSRTASIELYKSSNGQHVGYFTEDEITGVITSSEWDEATTGIEKGDVYIAVYNPKNKLVAEGTELGQLYMDGNDHTWKIDLAKANGDGKIEYAEDVTGKYTVKVYTVYNVDVKDGEIYDVDYVTETAYFTVSDNQAKIAYMDRRAISTTKDFKTDMAEIILDTFDFTFNGNYWNVETKDGDANMIVEDSWKFTDKGDYIILHSVKVKVPFCGDDSLLTGESYYEVEVKGINMSIKAVEE